ncbi:hypothetical protein TRIUR3_11463 [Triticum urartu]|uniref:Uncharacterized protein n=1 Tax=Triticum urartu TaxID=4572 RepID=M7YP55_TRIUA|nr:hypothetical protein TRIUR3_11463 [Triticum urartu]
MAFPNAFDDCELVDLGFKGVPFTYDNKRRGRKNVKAWAATGDKSDLGAIQDCLGSAMESLQAWSSPKFGNILRELESDTLRQLKSKSDLSWTVMDDFNEALWQFEHFSFTARAEGQMVAFPDTFDDCELVDLGFKGVLFIYISTSNVSVGTSLHTNQPWKFNRSNFCPYYPPRREGSSDMSGGIRRQFLNLGLFDERNRAYSLRRLDLSKMDFFHRTAQEAATHGKVVPTLTPAKACAPNRRRICKTDLATAEAAAPKINPPKSELFVRPLEVSYSIRSPCCLHFLPTASESKVISADHANRMLRFDTIDGCS